MVKNKSTHSEYRTELFMPIMKEADGKYIAVLSDDSVDRDEEKCSKACVERMAQDDGYLAALCNHDNDVFMQVAEWTNRGCREVDGHTALIAEPRFFLSNPNAKAIKGMLDDGAKLGVSIGAIVKRYDEIDGMIVFQELELVEASFVAVPSNRHGRALALAKSFNNKKKTPEANTVEKEFTKKDLDSALEKQSSEMKTDFEKSLELEKTKVTDLTKQLEETNKSLTDVKKEAEDGKTKLADSEKKVEETEKALETEKKATLEKQQFVNQGGDPAGATSQEDIDKALSEGKLPVMRF